MTFMFEPIMDGYLPLFYRFCMLNGMTEGLHFLEMKKEKRYDHSLALQHHTTEDCP